MTRDRGPSFDPGDPAAVEAAVERWFVRRGIPHAIDDYSATTDVFTRAAPLLSLIFLAEVFNSFDDRFAGWAQALAFCGGVAIMVSAVVVVNRLRGRRPFRLPDDIELPELVLFVFVPALLPVLFGNDGSARFLTVVVANLVILAVVYVGTSYGVVPMIRFGAVQMWRRLSGVGLLMARTLPLLLLFTAFIFLNAEMWQVASDFTPALYLVVIALLLGTALAFMAMRAPREVADLETFDGWAQVHRLARAARSPLPVPDDAHTPDGAPDTPPLMRSAHRNVTLLVLISQAVQVVLVAVVIGAFYVGFGLLAVRQETIDQWTTSPHDPITTFSLLGAPVVLTWEHFAVAGFIAVFSALQFAVSVLTDATYRDEFYDDVTGEIRRVLAVRALYYEHVVSPD